MSITIVGAVLIPLGIVLAVVRPRWLYYAAVFFLPFTATAVFNIGSGKNASGIQASLFLDLLLLLRLCVTVLRTGALPSPRHGRAGILWLWLFVAAVMASLIMPLWINGHIQIPSSSLLDPSTQPLYFKGSNITGFLYVLLGVFFAYLTAVWNYTPAMVRATLRAFLAGAAFSALWACLELACKFSGISYPAVIFNSSETFSAGGYQETLAEGVFRLSSVAVEPSVFAQSLLLALALYLPFVFGPKSLFGRTIDRAFFSLMLVILLMTTSSTAYIGAVLMALLVLFLLAIRGALRFRHFLFPLAGVALAGLIYAVIPLARQVVDAALLSKGGGYSALERLKTISDSYQMFLRYPLLGIGWTSITSHDLIVNILANCGILGLAAFTVAMYAIFRALYCSIWSRRNTLAAMMQPDLGSLVALAAVLITSVISGFIYMFPFFWFICGFAIASATGAPLPGEIFASRRSSAAVNMQQMPPDPN